MHSTKPYEVRKRRREIAACRVVRGLTQRQTAEFLGLSLSTVKRADAIRKAQGGGK